MAIVTFSGSYGSHMKFEVLMGTVSQSIDNNTSVIRVWCNLYTDGYASMYGVTAPLTIQVNGGEAIENVAVNINTNSKVTLWQKEYTIGHDPNGKKTTNIYLKLDLNTGGYGSAAYGWNPDLPIIPRASTLSDITGTLGSAMTINISRKDSNFTHNLKYEFGKLSGSIATGVGTSCTWTPPLSLATAMPNKTSDWGQIVLETYKESEKVGQTNCILTLNVPSTMKPTFTGITLSDNNTTTQNLIPSGTTFVEILSLIKVTFNGASGIQGSTIKGYKAELVNNNQTVTSNGGAFGIIRKTGELTVRASVQDSRGIWSNTKDTKITLIEYFSPLNNFKVERSGSARTTLTVTRTAKIAPLTVGGKQLNKMTITFKTRPVGGTTWTTNNGAASGTFTTISELLNSSANLAGTFAGTQSWEVYGEVEDLFDKTAFSAIVSTDSVLVSKTKNGLGVGKIRERGMLDVGGDIYANNKLIQHHQLTNNDGKIIQVARNTDMNTIVETGFYCGEALLNRPTASGMQSHTYFRVQRFDTNATWVLQEAIDFYGVLSAYRVKKSGAWTDWQYYAVQNKVAEFTAVNQTKVYTATINGPYGANLSVARCGNIVNASMDAVITATLNVSGTASETIPIGYRPAINQHLRIIGSGGGGTSAALFTNSYVDVTYSPDGKISHRTKLTDAPLAFKGSISWITSDPFPS
ncbi:DUF859 family phage minor structural protein [Streptococcus gallolyticus]|uniref:DUF859 family phage minor structural protein n=1 Tax=Streptococcus gallolyticus TaxID=315405 RepID=UPI002283C83D|nr:DUF859 family phage minor structural protein [Streptococcus gallolyticus]MCY7173681.1 DUF859 domain-containing protein [Streptococcus gallolyticus subsp. gallolyticus]MCY7175802.1 DUF859 domain-containing protein [Streptococcus gallolyticus subsp. gallolyticus]MCY7180256.1 DUF859 domain-containing protein [Streptococcus gallolyticus subsp. gallolyticus]MCY7184833.1 DUF859 domain-containing protein [Streptococcus gallolyticus subsp. gallolyticus]MCY7190057.1 DUF859 domain-containing protein 